MKKRRNRIFLSTTGCRVEVIAFKESTSAKLIEKPDEFTNISENKKKFLI